MLLLAQVDLLKNVKSVSDYGLIRCPVHHAISEIMYATELLKCYVQLSLMLCLVKMVWSPIAPLGWSSAPTRRAAPLARVPSTAMEKMKQLVIRRTETNAMMARSLTARAVSAFKTESAPLALQVITATAIICSTVVLELLVTPRVVYVIRAFSWIMLTGCVLPVQQTSPVMAPRSRYAILISSSATKTVSVPWVSRS